MLLQLWRRIEAGALLYFADQLAANKDAEIAELKALVPEGEATIAEFNKAIESRVSPLARGILDIVLTKAEQTAEDDVIHDAPAFLDKVVAEARAEAAKLQAE